MPRCPPGSTLFPYTTLFRSFDGVAVEKIGIGDSFGAMDLRPVIHATEFRPAFLGQTEDAVGKLEDDERVVDRKSTRLYSSHRCISYAVFCLKKKNKQHHQTI